jgi:hypothetical protein
VIGRRAEALAPELPLLPLEVFADPLRDVVEELPLLA